MDWNEAIKKLNTYLLGDHGLFEHDNFDPPLNITINRFSWFVAKSIKRNDTPPQNILFEPDGSIILEMPGDNNPRFVIDEFGVERQHFNGSTLEREFENGY